MYDLEKINKIIDDIARFTKDLSLIGLNVENVENVEKLHSSAMVIFGIMNRAIDLAEEIIVKNDLQMPSSYSECFKTLGKEGIIDKKLSENMERLIKQRNILAHHYYDARGKDILRLAREIYLTKEFVESIKKRIKAEQK